MKKSRRQVRRLQDREPRDLSEEEQRSQDSGSEDIEESEEPEVEDLTQKFGLRAINDEEGLQKRLKEVQGSFYNRLESAKLIKK